MRPIITVISVILIILIAGAGLSFVLLHPFSRSIKTTDDVIIRTAMGTHRFRVAIADDDHERAAGLMQVNHIDDDEGMLFVFDDENVRTFWMKNTIIPLDMIFIDSGFRIVSIQKNAVPCTAGPCPTYPSVLPVMYVLEINGGLADEKNINAGDVVAITR